MVLTLRRELRYPCLGDYTRERALSGIKKYYTLLITMAVLAGVALGFFGSIGGVDVPWYAGTLVGISAGYATYGFALWRKWL